MIAAKVQAEYLLNKAPEYESKIISHRKDVEAALLDFVYLFPPSLAVYAVLVHSLDIWKRL